LQYPLLSTDVGNTNDKDSKPNLHRQEKP
jgi:hypothetical protein